MPPAMAETNGADDRVTMVEMPAGHTPTWGNLVPVNYFEETLSEPPSAVQEGVAVEEVVTMRELRSTDGIEPHVRMGECRLYSVTYDGPKFGFYLAECSERVCVQGPIGSGSLVGCQVGSILVAVNGRLIPHGYSNTRGFDAVEKLDYESLRAAKPQTTMKNTWSVNGTEFQTTLEI